MTSTTPSAVGASAPIDPVTERVRATWTAGDFGRIATSYATDAAGFVARLELAQGERVLDVACGTGNLSIPAARHGALVTGIDIAPNLIAQALAAASNEGLAARFEVGDAEALPYPDASFDTVVSMFGAMFAARPERVTSELARVVRPGGRIALASWTASGFIGRMFRIVAGYVPPRAGAPSPLLWGDEAAMAERLGGAFALWPRPRRITFEFACAPAGVVELFRDYYGPTVHAFAALDRAGREAMFDELERHWAEHNHAADGTTRVESEYLELLGTRR